MMYKAEAPQMTPGLAALVQLMQRYLNGLLDPFVSLLELHKLMYFMQESGEPLRLRFQKAHYGPYAENLRHVLNAIEGHLVSGYSDGGDLPDKPLSLIPGATQEAKAFLEQRAETQHRFQRVADLVTGFESPFGLELLSTVHWTIRYEALTSPDAIAEYIYAWNERKRQFTPRQIALAVETLQRKGWITSEVA